MRGVYSLACGTRCPNRLCCSVEAVSGTDVLAEADSLRSTLAAATASEGVSGAAPAPPGSTDDSLFVPFVRCRPLCVFSEEKLVPGGAMGEGASSRYVWKRRCGNVVPKKAPSTPWNRLDGGE